MAHSTNAAPSLFISTAKTVIATKNKNADQNMPPEQKIIPCDTSSNLINLREKHCFPLYLI